MSSSAIVEALQKASISADAGSVSVEKPKLSFPCLNIVRRLNGSIGFFSWDERHPVLLFELSKAECLELSRKLAALCDE